MTQSSLSPEVLLRQSLASEEEEEEELPDLSELENINDQLENNNG